MAKAVVGRNHHSDLGPDFDGSITNLSPMLCKKQFTRRGEEL